MSSSERQAENAVWRCRVDVHTQFFAPLQHDVPRAIGRFESQFGDKSMIGQNL